MNNEAAMVQVGIASAARKSELSYSDLRKMSIADVAALLDNTPGQTAKRALAYLQYFENQLAQAVYREYFAL